MTEPKKENEAEGPIQVDSPMKKWKSPQPLAFVKAAASRWSFPNWQSGNDDSVYYNMNIPSFFKTQIAFPPENTSILERNLMPELLDLTYVDEGNDNKERGPLKEYLVGPKQVQAMMMMHQGKVVFEVYPGMNPRDIHIWMSASKTSASLLCVLLWEDGKLDFEKSPADYVPDLKGTPWENVTVKHVMNMCTAMDIEETFASLSNPKSWIASFFTALMEGKGDWRELLRTTKPLDGEKPNERFRYSTANTQVLTIIVEEITNMCYTDFFNERIWSKIGPKDAFIMGLTTHNTAVGGGSNVTTIEDMLRYAAIFTPSWKVVAKEPVVSEKALKCIFEMGNPACYPPSEEAAYGLRWFGHMPEKNTAQWDHAFPDGAMFKHGNMGQGIYVDPNRDFCACYFGLASNDETVTGPDMMPGYLRAAAKKLAGK
ncbi:Betalactamase [Seminavis robusta]|uniref:Betalactamase n=1 Tax=Seminavis robusta TaxID=568900 RepID=A0A9N8HEF0_9STRA|nr:Betalactamase [Seminavis robusta]|eukprot:Sro403_g135710.1 Betalactamase (428) ;mRNA; r:39846-41129